MAVVDQDRVHAGLTAQLLAEQAHWGDEGEAWLSAPFGYTPDAPVEVRVRKRRWRYDVDDDGAAVRRAGEPRGWLPVAERIVEGFAINVNRRGVIFVPAVEGRDLAQLAVLVASASAAVHDALLELG